MTSDLKLIDVDKIRQEIYQDLINDSIEYCCYCGQAKHRIGCCGENHFETYAEMRQEDQKYILDEMVADELEKLAKEMK